MIRLKRTIPLLHSVRIRLLVLLAVLSLPLLIISLVQMGDYRRSLQEQDATIARIEATAARGILASWLETHQEIVGRPEAVTPAESDDLYRRFQQRLAPEAGTVIYVFDRSGRIVTNPASPGTSINLLDLPQTPGRWKWTDGVERMTMTHRAEPYGWTVAVGVPLAENVLTSGSVIKLTLTWAVALLASICLGIWAVGRFTKPLRKLVSSASTLGEGNLRERVAVETEDEVGALAEGFNLMAEHLETKFNELQTQSAFIEEVMDGLPLGVLVLDKSLIVRKANPMFARALGRDVESLTGRGLYEAAAGLAVLSDVVEDVRRTRKPFVTYGLPLNLIPRSPEDEASFRFEPNFWDITIWPTTERSASRGDLILILSEVSKRVRAERLATSAFAAERERAAELESVISQMNEGVIIIDRHGRYKVNPAAAEIMGRERSEFRDGAEALIEDFVLRNLEGEALPLSASPLYRALRLRESISGEQVRVVRPDKEMRVITISATPLTGEQGDSEGAVAVFRDTTEEVHQHGELVAAYDRLREHDRLKSAFVSNVTHELRTPLNVIIGLCQLLQRDPQLPLAPLQSEAVVRMERNARSLLELVNDLLDYSRLEAGRAALHLERFDVASLVKEIVDDYSAEIQSKQISLKTEISEELGTVLMDRYKLSQVLSNLVGNAIKFTSAGNVTIACRPLDAERWCLEVSDTGIGISRDALAYIFDEFRQVDDRLARSYGGTGLGLAITRKIVELMEGEISVESRPAEGSHFRITWPRTVRQRTGTGSLVEKESKAVFTPVDLRSRAL
ncbi:MAG: PAS domain-containing protein [Pyrinomonadaceae bacterium]|nr:PAS domain-containing protein [Pyrinomonadaceae bacterium]